MNKHNKVTAVAAAALVVMILVTALGVIANVADTEPSVPVLVDEPSAEALALMVITLLDMDDTAIAELCNVILNTDIDILRSIYDQPDMGDLVFEGLSVDQSIGLTREVCRGISR